MSTYVYIDGDKICEVNEIDDFIENVVLDNNNFYEVYEIDEYGTAQRDKILFCDKAGNEYIIQDEALQKVKKLNNSLDFLLEVYDEKVYENYRDEWSFIIDEIRALRDKELISVIKNKRNYIRK